MKVLCLLLEKQADRLPALAEACLVFTPQIAVSQEAIFLEIGASEHLFSTEECLSRLREILELFQLPCSLSIAQDIPSALASARYHPLQGLSSADQQGLSSARQQSLTSAERSQGISFADRSPLPIEALSDFLSPFSPEPFRPAPLFRKLGVETLGDLMKLPRQEIASRFGKDGLLAYGKILEAANHAWPRFRPVEKLFERADLDFASQVETFEPVLFLLKAVVDRIFFRLYARREKLVAFDTTFHLNRLSRKRIQDRVSTVRLPLPQSDPKNLLALLQERFTKELERHPLEEALEGVSVLVTETAPFLDTQRDFFSRAEEQQEAWSSLVARLRERLGPQSAFLANPAPRILPEASWKRDLEEDKNAAVVPSPLRPLRLIHPPVPLQRFGTKLQSKEKAWKIQTFAGPEKLCGEWWLGGFEREYYRVETQSGEVLWVFSAPTSVKEGSPRALYLHGIYD